MSSPKPKMKQVGKMSRLKTPAEFHAQGQVLKRQFEKLTPYPQPRGFVYKAKTWEDYENWRAAQDNPRLW